MSGSRGRTASLLKPGDLSQDHLEVLVRLLRAEGGLSEQSERRLLQVILRFLRFLDRGCGVATLQAVTASHVTRFVGAPAAGGEKPSIATSHLRRSAVRLLFTALRAQGAVDHDPTLDLRLPPRSPLATRPLSDDEITLGRSFSQHSLNETRLSAAWALAEATARTSELPGITFADLDLGAGRVWIAGGSKTDPRWGQLTDWGVQTLARRRQTCASASLNRPVIYSGDGSPESRQASGCAAISETLRRAGLADEPDVRPASIAAWAGAQVLEGTGRIDDVARALGVRSLDRAARLVAWDWTSSAEQ